MQNIVVVLGTGGTIAGTAADPKDWVGYTSGTVGVDALVAGAGAGAAVETEQIAQLDSKDMEPAVWRRLAWRAAQHLARPEVAGVVVTHGTDTLEETAYFLHRVLAPGKPLVLTGAMRPASADRPDGPGNLRDAIALARDGRIGGVTVVFAGRVWRGADARKRHPSALDAIDGGGAAALGRVVDGRVEPLHEAPPAPPPLGLDTLPEDGQARPRVEIVTSHAGASGAVVRALVADEVDGIVAAATGNGTLHHALEAALVEAQRRHVVVLRATRCGAGTIVSPPGAVLPDAGALTPAQARVELMLRLLAER